MSELSIHYHNAAVDAAQAGKLDKALMNVERALTEDPQDQDTWQLYIIILTSLGRNEDALKATEQLKSFGMHEVQEQLLLAANADKPEDALNYYQAAIALDPKYPQIYPDYAIALMNHGDSEAAQKAAEKGVALAPDEPNAHYALGHILRLNKKKEPALAALNKAVALDPQFMIAIYEQGMILTEKGKFLEAIAKFEKVLKAHPGDSGATTAIQNIKNHLNH